MTITRWCSGCAADAAFERFDCREHPEECIELVCVLCGEGIEFAPPQVVAPARGVRVSPAA